MATGPADAVRVALSGPGHLLRGFGTWRTRPRLMAWGALPALLVLGVLVAGFAVLALQLGDLAQWLTPFADGWGESLRDLLRLGVGAVLVVGYLAASAALFVVLTLLVGEPFYDHIWKQAEEMYGGQAPTGEVAWSRSLRDSVVLLARGAAVGLALFGVGFVPVVGTVVAAVGGVTVAAWVLAAELLARPLEARGMDAAARRALLRSRPASVLGYGFSVQACFWVPLGAVVTMPAAVVGATSLARHLLDVSGPAAPQGDSGRG
ncbi:MAG: EI24 domain-containing protein [Nocardioides sp.]|uniref:EI24 domain-containing protein n=1 Tax=Nocardioides sp. TaxID=35761 RepID=UPI003F0AED17